MRPTESPRYLAEIRKLVRSGPKGDYELSLDYFDFVKGRRMYSDKLPELLGEPPRTPDSYSGRGKVRVSTPTIPRILAGERKLSSTSLATFFARR